MKDLQDLVKWKRANRPTRQSNNYKLIKDMSPNKTPQHVIDAFLVDLASGEFESIADICEKHQVSGVTVKRYADEHGVEFAKKNR